MEDSDCVNLQTYKKIKCGNSVINNIGKCEPLLANKDHMQCNE